MGTKLVVAEYMAPSLLWFERIGKLVLTTLSLVVVAVVWMQLNNLLEKKQEYIKYEEKYDAYENFLEQGHRFFEENNFEESERCYRSAMELLPKAEAPYLGLSEVFCAVREYEEALKALEAYSGQENAEIQAEINKLQQIKESLEQSVFH